MKKRLFIWLCCRAALITNAAAQGKISGKVYDSKSGLPVEYATVAVLKVQDSSLVTGTVTESNGSFSVNAAYGKYLLRISFMGYQTYFHPQAVVLSDGKSTANVGKITISPSAVMPLEPVKPIHSAASMRSAKAA